MGAEWRATLEKHPIVFCLDELSIESPPSFWSSNCFQYFQETHIRHIPNRNELTGIATFTHHDVLLLAGCHEDFVRRFLKRVLHNFMTDRLTDECDDSSLIFCANVIESVY